MSKLSDATTAFTFDDFVLVPAHSNVKSRKDPNISVNVPRFTYKVPVVSSPMNTVTEEEMLFTMARMGAVGVLHRYLPIDEQANICKRIFMRLKDAFSSDSELS